VTGFRPKRAPFKLDFTGEYEGLEVTVRPVPLGLLRDDASVTEALGRSLVSWNVKDGDGQPVPATAAGLAGRDPELTAAVSGAYLRAVGRLGLAKPVPVPSFRRAVPPVRKARPRRGAGPGAEAKAPP
jgi:hypothetical protein